MNASGRLNTCKSWGSADFGLAATGKRVRNTYATFLRAGNSLSKERLIPHSIVRWHLKTIKAPAL